MKNDKTKVVTLRIPQSVHATIVERSTEWDLTISFLVREVLVKVFTDDNLDTITPYRRRRSDGDEAGDKRG